MSIKKKNVLFVGSFKSTSKDGSVGGQMFASKTLINSNISDFVDWTLIDTTSEANILSSSFVRLRKAVVRLIKFVYYILFFKYDVILIFVADGWSFWEKGLMSLLAKLFTNSKVLLAPRSGLIINDLNDNPQLRRFIQYVFRKVDVVICQSLFWKHLFENLSNRTSKTQFAIIENLIDFNKYARLPIKRSEPNVVSILFMAWVTRKKGIFELIEAIKLLKKDRIKFNLLIAGKGLDFEKISEDIRISKLSDCVTLKGWVLGQEKLKILSEVDIFVLPTYFDGYPNSLLEAMASAKACIATKVGSIPDMIDHDVSGILIDSHNHFQLFEGLKKLIENPVLRDKISCEARDRVKNKNAEEVIIEKYKSLFF